MWTVTRESLLQICSLLLGCIYVTKAQSCDSSLGQSCYKYFSSKQSWQNAENDCQSWDPQANLVSVNTKEEQDHIVEEMKKKNLNSMWLGGREIRTDWRWIADNSYIQLQGCFEIESTETIFQLAEKSEDILPETCIKTCRAKTKNYAAVYVNSANTEVRCLCGDRYANYESTEVLLVQTDGCTVRCIKKDLNDPPYCGGYNKMAVYRTAIDTSGVNLWYRDQPNNYRPYQECLAIVGPNGYKWGDEACHKTENYICQYKFSMSECKNKGHIYAANTCYSTHTIKMNWFGARHDCEIRDGALLKLTSTELHDELKSTLTTVKWWIGGTNRRWTWPKGELRYSAWADDVPNSPVHTCMVLNRDANPGYRWDDEDCSSTHAFVCEKDSSTTLPTTTTSQPTTTTKAPTTTTPPSTTRAPTTSRPTTKPTTVTTHTTTLPTKPTTQAQVKHSTQAPAKNKTQAPPKETSSTADTSTTPKPTTTKKQTTVRMTTKQPATSQSVKTNSQGQPMTNPTTGSGVTNPGGATDGSKGGKTTPNLTSASGDGLLLPKGVIVAIAVACVAVLAAFIRLVVYCATNRRAPKKKLKRIPDHENVYENEYSRPASTHAYDNHINEVNSTQDTISGADSGIEAAPEKKSDTEEKSNASNKKKGGMDWAY